MKTNRLLGSLLFLVLLSSLLFAGGSKENLEVEVKPIESSFTKQAPMLDVLEAQKVIPTLEERLSNTPMVIKAPEAGIYGGTWNRAAKAGGDDANQIKVWAHEPLVRWTENWGGPIPNVAQSWEVSSDGKDIIFYLREGMKWSDGHLFTSEDIVFWYEAYASDPNLKGMPSFMIVGGEPGKVEALGDYAVKFSFVAPAGRFIRAIAGPDGNWITHFPKHYFAQFHPSYNPEAENLAKEMGFDSWTQLWTAKGGSLWGIGRYNAEIPVLHAWKPETTMTGNSTTFTVVRNPYYWKVDEQGRQLPYIDRITYTFFQDVQSMVLAAAGGQIDMQGRHINAVIDNKAFLYDNQEKGNYHLIDMEQAGNNSAVLMLNLNANNEVLNTIFNDVDFRIAISHAINRQKIIDTLYLGQTKAHQPAPIKGSEFYDETFSTQYTEYDIEKAQEMLDALGYKLDQNGRRIGPDGNPISFTVITIPPGDEGQFIVEDLNKIGIGAQLRVVARDLLEETINANTHDAVIWFGEGGIDPYSDMRNYFPYNTNSWFAPKWAKWYVSGGTNGEKPSDEKILKQFELWDTILITTDTQEQARLMKQLLELSADLFYCIGISTYPPSFAVVSNRMYNVPQSMFSGWQFVEPASVNPQIFYLK